MAAVNEQFNLENILDKNILRYKLMLLLKQNVQMG